MNGKICGNRKFHVGEKKVKLSVCLSVLFFFICLPERSNEYRYRAIRTISNFSRAAHPLETVAIVHTLLRRVDANNPRRVHWRAVASVLSACAQEAIVAAHLEAGRLGDGKAGEGEDGDGDDALLELVCYDGGNGSDEPSY